jgi:hypothetical protein
MKVIYKQPGWQQENHHDKNIPRGRFTVYQEGVADANGIGE